jgi:hypothetical protein
LYVFNKVLNDWIDRYLDHSTLVAEADKTLLAFLIKEKQKYYLVTNAHNTTLEYLSKHLYHVFNTLLKTYNIQVIALTLFENPTASVTYEHP